MTEIETMDELFERVDEVKSQFSEGLINANQALSAILYNTTDVFVKESERQRKRAETITNHSVAFGKIKRVIKQMEG